MSLCEFEDVDGQGRDFRCARQATHRVEIRADFAGNLPYEKLYCPAHVAYYLEPGPRALPREEFAVTELPDAGGDEPAPYVVLRQDGDDDDF